MNIANRVKSRRIQLGLSQSDLAKQCGIRPPSLSNIESGKTKYLKAETLLRLSKALGCDAEWVMRGGRQQYCSEPLLSPKERQMAAKEKLRSTGARIRNRRNELGLTLQSIANLLGVTRAAVSAWELGGTKISADNLTKLALILHMSPFELTDINGKVEPGPATDTPQQLEEIGDITDLLANNLRRLMQNTPGLQSQMSVASVSAVSQRTIGAMLNPKSRRPTLSGKVPSPRLGEIEMVARTFGLSTWQLLIDEETVGAKLASFLIRPKRDK